MTATANDQKTGRAVAGEELFESLAHFVVIHNGQASECRADRGPGGRVPGHGATRGVSLSA